LIEKDLSVVQAMKPLSLWRRLLRLEDFASQFPPPKIDSESQARDVRAALETLITNNVKRFDMLFLQGEACAAQPAEREYLDVLAKAGYVKKTIGMVFRPCVRVFVLDDHFIATDLLSHTDEDQVFSLMMEQVLLVRAMDVRKGDHVLELCLGSGVNTLSAASRGAGRAVGVDISGRAVAFAKSNALVNLRSERDETRLETFQGSLFEPLDSQDQFDLILINPPFELVPPGGRYFLHSHGGEDGLDVIRAFLPGLKSRLKPGGRFEMFTWAPGDEQNERVSGLVAAALPGYRVEVIQADCLPLEDRIATFRNKPVYQEWKNRLMAQGITHIWGVHVRALESNVSEIVRIEARELVAECFAIASEWSPKK
jgi:SAM-dependent methyltransferase